jgi:hypothetical protein
MSHDPWVAKMKARRPRGGLVMRRCTIPHPHTRELKRFKEGDEWYKVDDIMAGVLREVRSEPHDADSPLQFVVMRLSEARRLHREEVDRRRRAAETVSVIDIAAPSGEGSRAAAV